MGESCIVFTDCTLVPSLITDHRTTLQRVLVRKLPGSESIDYESFYHLWSETRAGLGGVGFIQAVALQMISGRGRFGQRYVEWLCAK